MPIYDNEIVFLHIPKTGGTVIEYLLKKQRKVKVDSLCNIIQWIN